MLAFFMHDLEKEFFWLTIWSPYTTPSLLCAPGNGNLETLVSKGGGLLSVALLLFFF
jgi:hypothetical protein